MSTQAKFSHENLVVYQKTIAFVVWSQDLIDRGRMSASTKDQFERAGNSIALNIAEGNGKRSPRDRGKYWQIAQGSALECAAVLDVLVARRQAEVGDITTGKALLLEIVSMLVALIDNLENRLREEPVEV